jgi:hypothetical protein
MARVAGITMERNMNSSYARINLYKHPEFIPLLKAKGVDVELIPNETTKKAIKEANNHKQLKGYTSVDKLLADCLK